MASMREIKSRITATKKTSQITKAMHMVSASKLKKAERVMTGFRPIMTKLRDMIDNMLLGDELSHPMLQVKEVVKTCYILVSSDRGLAGPYNAAVFKEFSKHVAATHSSNDEFCVASIGFKAFSYVRRMGYVSMNTEAIHVRDDIQFIDFKSVSKMFTNEFLDGSIDQIVVFHNHFINTMVQEVTSTQLLPIMSKPEKETTSDEETHENEIKLIYDYEPNPQDIINNLLPMYVENTLYGIILDAKASEHAARMTAMKSATDNAEDVIHTLQLHYNRARQAAITVELTDIIGGANAVS